MRKLKRMRIEYRKLMTEELRLKIKELKIILARQRFLRKLAGIDLVLRMKELKLVEELDTAPNRLTV